MFNLIMFYSTIIHGLIKKKIFVDFSEMTNFFKLIDLDLYSWTFDLAYFKSKLNKLEQRNEHFLFLIELST